MKFIQLLIAVSLTAFLGCNKETGTLGEEAQTKTTAQDGSSSSMKKTIQSLWEVTSEQWEVGEQQIRAVFKDQFGDKMHGILARMKVDTLEYARQQGKTGNGVEDGRIQDSLRHAIMVEGRFSERDADRWIAKNGTAMERWVLKWIVDSQDRSAIRALRRSFLSANSLSKKVLESSCAAKCPSPYATACFSGNLANSGYEGCIIESQTMCITCLAKCGLSVSDSNLICRVFLPEESIRKIQEAVAVRTDDTKKIQWWKCSAFADGTKKTIHVCSNDQLEIVGAGAQICFWATQSKVENQVCRESLRCEPTGETCSRGDKRK